MTKKKWSRDYAECRNCGTTKKPHKGKGYCMLCYHQLTFKNLKTQNQCMLCFGDLGSEFGYNAEPVMSGRCCQSCNDYIIIPIRIMRISRQYGKD